MPYQLELRPIVRPWFGRIAGVHSIEWILAITAALTSRATLNSRLSSQSGYARFRWSQMALCSRANSVCSIATPTHQLRIIPLSSTPLAPSGRVPSSREPEVAVDAAPQAVLGGLVAAVDLRPVPPVGDLVDVRHRRRLADLAAGGVGLGPADEHPVLAEAPPGGVVLVERDLDDVVLEHLAVGDPVAVLELDPGRGEEVEERHLLHRARRG